MTFTGFSPGNPLRGQGDLSIWVDCEHYNIIETIHLFWILTVIYLIEAEDTNCLFIHEARKIFLNGIGADDYTPLLIKLQRLCEDVRQRGSKLIFLGNGGSSSIASHAATDFTKQGKVRSIAFNDHNLLTCYANDYGQTNWMAEALKAYFEVGDVVVLLSSSGESENILRAADYVNKVGLEAVAFSAFRQDNSLNSRGLLTFWAPSMTNCVSQSIHSALLLSVCDSLSNSP